VNSQITEDFLNCFRRLPEAIREKARKAYRLWRTDPQHPGLHFKKIHATEPLYSVRVGIDWRVLGLLENDTMTWFWIGSHAEYDQIIKQF
jgi:hypothetical protein